MQFGFSACGDRMVVAWHEVGLEGVHRVCSYRWLWGVLIGCV